MLNLMSEWKFDGNTNDSWGSNNGTWSGPAGTNTAATYSSDCIFNQCLSFDGSDDCVTVTNNTSLDVTTSFTMEMWIKRIATSSGQATLLRRDILDEYAFGTGGSGTTTVRARFRDTTANYHLGTLVSVPTGQWNHIVGTYDGTYLKFYLNGVVAANDNMGTYTVAAGTSDLIIGRDDAIAGRYFNGLIDGVRVYGAAVPLSLVKENYYAGINSLFSKGSISQSEYLERINNIARNE